MSQRKKIVFQLTYEQKEKNLYLENKSLISIFFIKSIISKFCEGGYFHLSEISHWSIEVKMRAKGLVIIVKTHFLLRYLSKNEIKQNRLSISKIITIFC